MARAHARARRAHASRRPPPRSRRSHEPALDATWPPTRARPRVACCRHRDRSHTRTRGWASWPAPGYEELVEAIYEGYLQHYGEGRVLPPDDPDLALLAGDRLYALGLARLAELGDLEAVDVLAGVISRARAGARRGRSRGGERRLGGRAPAPSAVARGRAPAEA